MKLREIVFDDELQRIDALKDNAKRAHQDLFDARTRLKTAKVRQAMMRARMFSVPVASNRSNPRDTI